MCGLPRAGQMTQICANALSDLPSRVICSTCITNTIERLPLSFKNRQLCTSHKHESDRIPRLLPAMGRWGIPMAGPRFSSTGDIPPTRTNNSFRKHTYARYLTHYAKLEKNVTTRLFKIQRGLQINTVPHLGIQKNKLYNATGTSSKRYNDKLRNGTAPILGISPIRYRTPVSRKCSHHQCRAFNTRQSCYDRCVPVYWLC